MKNLKKALWTSACILITMQHGWSMEGESEDSTFPTASSVSHHRTTTVSKDFDPEIIRDIRKTITAHVDQENSILKGPICVDALFLGPHGENANMFMEFIQDALNDHLYWRRSFHPEDPFRITEEIKREKKFLIVQDRMQKHLRLLLAELKKYSNPLFSFRYQAHMYWEMTIPSLVGYIATILYNPNNVAFEGSPVTTCLEEQVAKDLCRMIGYSTESRSSTTTSTTPIPAARPSDPISWGHLTGGGTIANIEALWAARNVKFFPFAIKLALQNEKDLKPARELTVKLPDSSEEILMQCTAWELLNIESDEVLELPEKIFKLLQSQVDKTSDDPISFAKLYKILSKYSIQGMGLAKFYKELNRGKNPDEEIQSPVVLATGTRHYSFPKAVSLLGLGDENLVDIPVDECARMDVEILESELNKCMQNRQPVIAVAAIIGSTEESAVDPLADIFEKREDFRKKGLDFYIHADAAWGGYFSTLKSPQGVVPIIFLSNYVDAQIHSLAIADSVTIDPHKSGYMPYPAGSICYQNGAIKNMINFTAPYLSTEESGQEPILGIYGVEGSKPGASAAMVYLTHRVIPLNKNGYGTLLGQALYSTKIFYLNLLDMNKENKQFIVVPLAEPPANIKSTEEIFQDTEALRNIGPDLNVIAYAFNFYEGGKINTNLGEFNKFNDAIFNRLRPQFKKPTSALNLVVSHSALEESKYGARFLTRFLKRLQIAIPETKDYSVNVLRSVMMNPWVTETEQGSFMNIIMEALTAAIHGALEDKEKT